LRRTDFLTRTHLNWKILGEQDAMSLDEFREKLQSYRRAAGQSQKQIAREIGLNPHVLSHKLNATDGMCLNHPEVKKIIKVLVQWQAVISREEVFYLLRLMKMTPKAFTMDEWQLPPLRDLESDGEASV
jgi:hypothetical protein